MYSDQLVRLYALIIAMGGIVLGLAAIFLPLAIVVWPTTIDCPVVTGHTACQER
jgi:hypothetical protein